MWRERQCLLVASSHSSNATSPLGKVTHSIIGMALMDGKTNSLIGSFLKTNNELQT